MPAHSSPFGSCLDFERVWWFSCNGLLRFPSLERCIQYLFSRKCRSACTTVLLHCTAWYQWPMSLACFCVRFRQDRLFDWGNNSASRRNEMLLFSSALCVAIHWERRKLSKCPDEDVKHSSLASMPLELASFFDEKTSILSLPESIHIVSIGVTISRSHESANHLERYKRSVVTLFQLENVFVQKNK